MGLSTIEMENFYEAEMRWQMENNHSASYGWALSCCSYNETEAKDVLQTVYMKILDGRARFKGRSSFKTWLFAVIRNTAADERRRGWLRFVGLARYASERATDTASLKNEEPEDRAEMSKRLKIELARLSRRQQEILHLVFYQEMTLEAAASVMGVSIGSARTHYERGKHNLQKKLTEAEVFNER